MTTDDKTIRAARQCTIIEADAFRQDILSRLHGEDGDVIEIDLSAVEDTDITLIQLLLSAGKSAEAKGRTLSITSSSAVTDLLSRAGLPGWPTPSGS